MCPARIAVPTVAPGLAPYFHQPTIFGSSGICSSLFGSVPTLTIGALTFSFGISIRFGAMTSATWCATAVGTTPTLRAFACTLVPQYGVVTQVSPATAMVTSAAIAQANGTHPVNSSMATAREFAGWGSGVGRRLRAWYEATGLPVSGYSTSIVDGGRFGRPMRRPVQCLFGVRLVRTSRPCLEVHAVRPGRKVTAGAQMHPTKTLRVSAGARKNIA